MIIVLFILVFIGWMVELSFQIILVMIMVFTWFSDFFLSKTMYQIYTGDVSGEICSICLEDFSDEIPVTLPVCAGADGPKHFFHEECISRHSEYFDHCPMCRKVYKSSRYFKLGGINTNRYDMNRFNSGIIRFEYL